MAPNYNQIGGVTSSAEVPKWHWRVVGPVGVEPTTKRL